MNRRELNIYIQGRIENKLMSQIWFHRSELRKIFKKRHIIDTRIGKDLQLQQIEGCIRDLRVWQEIEVRCRL